MKLAIIKYNAGNQTSVDFALQRLGVNAIITDDVEEIKSANKVIFPGVGAAASAMQYLRGKKLDEVIKSLKQPFLGICLGMQLMCDFSEEGNVECLGIFKEKVRLFESSNLKVPQIGWNKIRNLQGELFKGLSEDYVYFVHSYYANLGDDTAAVADYEIPYSAALHRDNFYGAQFHPEKSGEFGEKILRNFVEL